jgi:hypothetical protein
MLMIVVESFAWLLHVTAYGYKQLFVDLVPMIQVFIW